MLSQFYSRPDQRWFLFCTGIGWKSHQSTSVCQVTYFVGSNHTELYLAEPSVSELSTLRLSCCHLSGQPEFDPVTPCRHPEVSLSQPTDRKSPWGPFYPHDGYMVLWGAEGSTERHKTASDTQRMEMKNRNVKPAKCIQVLFALHIPKCIFIWCINLK